MFPLLRFFSKSHLSVLFVDLFCYFKGKFILKTGPTMRVRSNISLNSTHLYGVLCFSENQRYLSATMLDISDTITYEWEK